MPDDLTKIGSPDRSKIAMGEEHEVKYWTKHLGISKEELQRAVDKVGNSAAAVKKELGSNRRRALKSATAQTPLWTMAERRPDRREQTTRCRFP